MSNSEVYVQRWRHWLFLGLVAAFALVVFGRAYVLQVQQKDFLQKQGAARQQRTIPVAATRGRILDRNLTPLAVSTPINSVWADPRKLRHSPERYAELAQALGRSPQRIQDVIDRAPENRGFVYLARHVDPSVANNVAALKIEGVNLQREYGRYYPTGEVASHVLGSTNIDGKGIEGLEALWDESLKGTPGERRVIRDLKGRAFSEIEYINKESDGADLVLSIDRRIQYVAYRELKRAVETHSAKSGSVVVMNTRTGEVLALANQPAFNPNASSGPQIGNRRNRAVTDPVEPGSTIKPFTIAAGLELGVINPESVIETSPGSFQIGPLRVRDFRDYGDLSPEGILKKSSNVGVTKVSLLSDPAATWAVLDRLGFGTDTGSLFPGENYGVLRHGSAWRKVEQATIAYGYGLSVTPLQLARAYSALANDGVMPSVTFTKRADPNYEGEQVLDAQVARAVRRMLESVVEPGGTGERARVAGYRVAGKTGTSWKHTAKGYTEDKYYAFFAGMAPASDPELVVVVMIDEPSGDKYYGGEVAAPAFAAIMSGALRVLGLPMDAIELPQRTAALDSEKVE
ncbi:peptidoglycan D,D-transpeptidase FtsI-like [Oratosquilla oratoria]|uniref:peptidoglycan D,D-transpeptidase FtsI-like n=1 Tax=Oratosquilla oratoria TaxID=337810 RepID=UPI003F76F6D3